MSRMPTVGDVVDDVFRIDEEVDHGNFGAVYKVTDLLEKRILALKVLKPGPHDEEELRRRFEREARLIYSLRHPHIVQVYYYGETDNSLPYMAMELLEGTDLKSLLRHHGGLSEALARRITIESLSALHSAHHMGIVHRDLKPGNIYLVNDGAKGHVKVLDFGFAKALESDNSSDITTAGTLVGTPAYMSPELVHKEDVGPGADLYAMGLILAEMLSGEKVVQIESIYDTVVFQGSEKPVKLPDHLRQSEFGPILERATAKDLDERYDTAVEMIEALRRLNLAGTGTYTDEVPLIDAPPEIGSADPEASTHPRSDGRPSLEEVEATIGDSGPTNPRFDESGDDEPTVDRSYSFESSNPASASGAHPAASGAHPAASGAHPAASGAHPTASGAHPAAHAQPRPEPQATAPHPTQDAPQRQSQNSGPSALRDVAFGVIIGGVVLAAILLWLSLG